MSTPTARQTTLGQVPRFPRFTKNLFWYALLTPALAALLAIIAGPAMYAILVSFRAWDLSDPASGQPFVGLQNYGTLLNDPYFWSALQTSTIFAVGAVTIELILGFGVALLLMDQRIFKRLITTIVLIPLMVTPVVVGLIWRYMYDPSDGLVYYLLGLIPGGSNFGGLTSTSTALVAVMLVDVWEMTPFIILVMVAGLAALPDEVFEAARIDGAGRLEQLRSITLPLLRPLILLVVLLRFMDAFRTFDSIYIMTGGGPGTSTEVISLYDFNTAFQSFQMGYGMTLAIATLLILLAVGAALIPLMRTQR